MSPRVSSHLSMAAGDALSNAKYRVLPTLQPAVQDALQDVVDRSDAQHGPRHEASLRALWALAQWKETEDDARGPLAAHGGYSARTRALFEELRRRGPAVGAPMRIAMWRFFAEDHRARGQCVEAERSLRRAIEAAREMHMPGDPLVLGFVSILRDWLAEWYGEDSGRAMEATRWYAELKHDALNPRHPTVGRTFSESSTGSSSGGQGQCVGMIE